MASWNFSDRYLTNNSYQCMDENTDHDDKICVINDCIEKSGISIININVNNRTNMTIDFDTLIGESGYYNGFRLEPSFYIELSLIREDEILDDTDCDFYNTWFSIHDDMVEENKWTTYSEVLITWLKEVAHVAIDNEDEFVKSLNEYFGKYDKVLGKFLKPYTIGWCASEVKDD